MPKVKLTEKIVLDLPIDDLHFLKKASRYWGTTLSHFMRCVIQQLRSADWATVIDDYEV